MLTWVTAFRSKLFVTHDRPICMLRMWQDPRLSNLWYNGVPYISKRNQFLENPQTWHPLPLWSMWPRFDLSVMCDCVCVSVHILSHSHQYWPCDQIERCFCAHCSGVVTFNATYKWNQAPVSWRPSNDLVLVSVSLSHLMTFLHELRTWHNEDRRCVECDTVRTDILTHCSSRMNVGVL